MSLFPARTREESIWQGCNYGYDTSKYKSFEDCMTKQGININFKKPELTKEQVLAFALDDYRKNLPLPDNDGFVKTNVLCNDGTIKIQNSSPNAEILDACINNGGVSPNQDSQKPRTFIEMNQGYIIIGLVLVAGYFAYKKFKK